MLRKLNVNSKKIINYLAAGDFKSADVKNSNLLVIIGPNSMPVSTLLTKPEQKSIHFLDKFIVFDQNQQRWFETDTFSARELVDYLAKFSDNIVPTYRKKNRYLNSVLARNELNSNYPSNRKLFIRKTHRRLYSKSRIKTTYAIRMASIDARNGRTK